MRANVSEKQLKCIEYEILIKYLSILKDKWINSTETLHRFQEILEFPIGGFNICIRGSLLEPGPMPWVEIWIDPPPPPILALAALPLGGNGVGGCTETETEVCDVWYFKFVPHENSKKLFTVWLSLWNIVQGTKVEWAEQAWLTY